MSNRARSASIHGDDGDGDGDLADDADEDEDDADDDWLDAAWSEDEGAEGAAEEEEKDAAENETVAVLAVGMAGLRVNEKTVGASDDWCWCCCCCACACVDMSADCWLYAANA